MAHNLPHISLQRKPNAPAHALRLHHMARRPVHAHPNNIEMQNIIFTAVPPDAGDSAVHIAFQDAAPNLPYAANLHWTSKPAMHR